MATTQSKQKKVDFFTFKTLEEVVDLTFYDYFVIASVTSDRQLQGAIAHVQDDLSKAKYQVARIEGKNSNSWVLIDSKDIIVNVFTKEERVYYNLEKMLVEIEQIKLEELK